MFGELSVLPGELLKPGRKGLFSRLLERALLPGNDGVFDEHVYKCFVSVLGKKASNVEQS